MTISEKHQYFGNTNVCSHTCGLSEHIFFHKFQGFACISKQSIVIDPIDCFAQIRFCDELVQLELQVRRAFVGYHGNVGTCFPDVKEVDDFLDEDSNLLEITFTDTA